MQQMWTISQQDGPDRLGLLYGPVQGGPVSLNGTYSSRAFANHAVVRTAYSCSCCAGNCHKNLQLS